MPPYPRQAMAHLAAPVGAGGVAHPDAEGEAGAAGECGDTVRISLTVRGGRVADAGFRAFGCGATTAAASAACARLRGRPLRDAMCLSAQDLDGDLGGMGDHRMHGPRLVEDAVARAVEAWVSPRLAGPGVPRHGRRVAVGMSGGVDSAVAALLLRDAGWDVVGVTMRLWHDPATAAAERSCCSPDTVRLARETAHHLGVPHVTVDAADAFRRGVVDAFAEGYRAGRTPNPCVTCNGEVRFRVLDQVAGLLGARHLATGHYARVAGGALARAGDDAKDQSYMLSRLPRALLARCLFPLGDLTKDTVRGAARAAALPATGAVESQDVCFVGAGGYVPFLERAYGMARRPGPVVDADGRVVGRHDGYWRYTVGQRRGVGVAGGEPRYVLGSDPATNTVVVGGRDALAARSLVLTDTVLHEPLGDDPLEVRVRYRGRPVTGVARPDGRNVSLILREPADAVAPGQTAALYRHGRLVASGVIAARTAGGSGA